MSSRHVSVHKGFLLTRPAVVIILQLLNPGGAGWYFGVWLKLLREGGVVDGEGVAVKDAWSGVVGRGVIKESFPKHLKTGRG